MSARDNGLSRAGVVAAGTIVLAVAVLVGALVVSAAWSADHQGALSARDAEGSGVDPAPAQTQDPTQDQASAGESPTEEPTEVPVDPTRIALLGDSVTQGASGDATWRYYLSQHLDAAAADYDFVGYRTDLFDPATSHFGLETYAHPGFDTDHAARWGMRLDAMDVTTRTLVRALRPDVLVEMLGINDLRAGVDPAVVLHHVRAMIADARAEAPDLDIVLVRLPHWWIPEFATFNAGLDQIAAESDTPGSRVVVAAPDLGFDEFADTWDQVHPNDPGQRRIADAVWPALAGIGVGTGPGTGAGTGAGAPGAGVGGVPALPPGVEAGMDDLLP